jgi:drug/metabolite transporter (DMT)-like permease
MLKLFSPGIRHMLLSTGYFALMNVCVKFLPRLPTHETVFFRALGMLFLCSGALIQARISPWGNHKGYLFLRGFYGTVGLNLYFYTLQAMPLASAVTLQYLSPIFSSVFALFLLREGVHPIQWICFALAFAGVFVIKGFETHIALLPFTAALGAAICSGLAYNYVRKLKDYDHPLVTVLYFPLVTLLLTGPYTLFHWVQPQGWEWLALILLGIFTYFAQIHMTHAYQAEQVAVVSSFNYLGAIYALGLGWLLFGELLSFGSAIGIGLIIVGVVMGANYKSLERWWLQRSH